MIRRAFTRAGTLVGTTTTRTNKSLVAAAHLQGTRIPKAHALSSSPAAAVHTKLPPNLMFDARSSFAPPPTVDAVSSLTSSAVENQDDDDGDEDDGLTLSETQEDEEDDDFDPDYASLDGTGVATDHRIVIPLPDRLQAKVYYGKDGSVSGSFPLEESVFGVDPVRVDLIKQAVDYIRAKIRGKRKNITKTISQVSGSGRKVRQQKGTGKARAGHSRPAHWRGGAKAHGPKGSIQDYGKIKMTKKMRQLAMASVLSQKLKEGNLIIMDQLFLESHKTQPWADLLEKQFHVGRYGTSALIVDHYLVEDEQDEGATTSAAEHSSYHGVPINLWVASTNIPKVKVVNPSFANVYEILKREKLIVTLQALKVFETRLKR